MDRALQRSRLRTVTDRSRVDAPRAPGDSADGTTWTDLGTAQITLPPTALVGLAVSSVADGTLSTAEFSGWVITPLP